MEALAVGDVLRERLLVADRDRLRRGLERRGSIPRARSRMSGADLAREEPRERRRRRARRARRSSRSAPRAGAPPRAGRPREGGARERREEDASRPAGTTVRPPGLRRSLATFATTLQLATPSEHERLVAARTAACTASRRRAPAEVRGDLPEVEVALVEAEPLDGRDDLAYGRPDRARVLAVAPELGRMKIACGQRRSASAALIAEWIPNARAS